MAKCRYCGDKIFGGKGDYWHVDNGNVYGSVLCRGGRHLAQPADMEPAEEPIEKVYEHRDQIINRFRKEESVVQTDASAEHQ